MKKKAKTKTKRSTGPELEARISQVLSWILRGHDRHDVVRFGSKWKVSSRQIDDYIAWAKERLMAQNTATIQEDIAAICKNLWNSYRISIDTGDVAEANKSLMNLAKIKGIGTININARFDDFSAYADTPDEELERRLAEAKNGG